MKQADRARLTSALREHVAKIAADLRTKMRAPGSVRERALRLHADERVADDFDVWTDLLSRRAAVLWVLKSVYVRVLEDRGLLSPGRLLDLEAQQLFERLAPHLGETAFLRWVYRDLASRNGGLPELFSSQPAEVALPSDELSRDLIAFWRHRDADTGSHWSFAEERFEGELMGDLYQDLDPVVKDRFALCQTPDFVRTFILERTLDPAVETFGADEVRLLDPACGSGHFLIDSLKRIVAATGAKHPEWSRSKVALHALDRVVGIDLNDYACALARTRLVMTAAELAGVGSLADAAQFHPHVYWADGLDQVEDGPDSKGTQLNLAGIRGGDKARATLTPPENRAALRRVLQSKFQAVVANPPYITENDETRKAYHREKTGHRQRYVSAYRQYSLGAPFVERCLQLATDDGFIGIITGNNFTKREFGKPLVEKVLARTDLTLVVDTSQADIPFHNTPTILLFARKRPPVAATVRAILGRKGETGSGLEPSQGRVWTSIQQQWNHVGFENEFVSVVDSPRSTFSRHPWSLEGGGAAELKAKIEASSAARLGSRVASIGRTVHTGLDDAFYVPRHYAQTRADGASVPLVKGEQIRDFTIVEDEHALFPYRHEDLGPTLDGWPRLADHLWRYRTSLRERLDFGKRPAELGIEWFEWTRFQRDRYLNLRSIAYAFVATHNHFAFDLGGKVFKQTAPALKLGKGATVEDFLSLLGVLNSSSACFWMKQVFHCKHQNFGFQPEQWMMRYEFDATKLKLLPLPRNAGEVVPYARELDRLARRRSERSVQALLGSTSEWRDPHALRSVLDARRASDYADMCQMVGLQEELDWLCYRLFDLTSEEACAVAEVEGVPPTWLPWALEHARLDAEAASERSDDDGADLLTKWFSRHRWEALQSLPSDAPATVRERVARRIRTTERSAALRVLESATYKRRWANPDYPTEEAVGLQVWLTERIEKVARDRGRPLSIDQIAASLQDDVRVLAVCEVLTGRRDFDLTQLVAERIASDAVPNCDSHIYKGSGLDKRNAWLRTWDEQRREDAGEDVTPDVAPSYGKPDFLSPEYYSIRGKLDVPRERFIAFTEIPRRSGAATLFGWAGWTPMQRLKAILAIDEELEDGGVPLADRAALLDSAWRLLPDVAREDAGVAVRLKAELQALVGPEGPSRELIEDWRKRNPPPNTRGAKTRRAKNRDDDADGESEEGDES